MANVRGLYVTTDSNTSSGTKRDKVFTYKALKIKWGWPYSRQHTHRLIKAGLFPPPMNAPGCKLNLWSDKEIDEYFARFERERTAPAGPKAVRRATNCSSQGREPPMTLPRQAETHAAAQTPPTGDHKAD
jgi:hypothetical protein